ncbi:MAG TPA: insulinase family protein, partial [Elusimicrobiales bacterium]|nr:insulinase family protein [Elusimicrobiales bacterium]
MKPRPYHAALRPALPAAGGLAFRPPAGFRRVLSNGLVVYLLRDDTLPMVHAAALIRTGKIYDPAGKIGLGELTLALLKDGGTLDRRAAEIDDTLDLLGARMEASIAFEEARVTMFSLKKDLDAVLDIFASVILRPAFEEEKVLLKKAEALEMIRRRNDDPARTAQREALRHFYGAGHCYGWRPESFTIEPLAGNDLKAYHARYFRPENIIIAAAGDFGDEDAFLKKLEARFGGPAGGRTAPPEVPPAEP